MSLSLFLLSFPLIHGNNTKVCSLSLFSFPLSLFLLPVSPFLFSHFFFLCLFAPVRLFSSCSPFRLSPHDVLVASHYCCSCFLLSVFSIVIEDMCLRLSSISYRVSHAGIAMRGSEKSVENHTAEEMRPQN